MNVTTIVCPACSKALKLVQSIPAGSMVRCTGCGRPFALGAAALAVRPADRPVPQAPAGHGFLVGLLFCGLLIAGGSVGLGIYLNRDKGIPHAALDPKNRDKEHPKDEKESDKDEDKNKEAPRTPTTDKASTDKKAADDKAVRPNKPAEETAVRPTDYDPTPRPRPEPMEKQEPPPKPDPMGKKDPPPKPDPTVKPEVKPGDNDLPKDEKAKIKEAVRRGLDALLAMQRGDGGVSDRRGMTALAGVTFLECEVPASDKSVQKAADFVRAEAIKNDETYAIATAILFLDRLGDPIDEPLLEALTVRLLSGQIDTGGWTYNTAAVPEDEVKRLEEHYKQAKEKKLEPIKRPRTVRDLAPEVQQRLLQIKPLVSNLVGYGDNSNTQFATLALWVGRRHGVPVDAALAGVDARFRRTQHKDGGWSYYYDNKQLDAIPTPSMTCAGVLALTLAHGAAQQAGKPADPDACLKIDTARDPILRGGLQRLARSVGEPPSFKNTPAPKLAGSDIYYLWSLERIMVVMNLEKIGGKDWYRWGAEVLLANQESNGRWSAEYGACGADTCFALLFLHRANLAKDLSITINKLELIDEDKPKK
jgi:hypothetical protein